MVLHGKESHEATAPHRYKPGSPLPLGKSASRRLRDPRRRQELWKGFDVARQRYYHRRKVQFAEVERRGEEAGTGQQWGRRGSL